MPNWSLFPIHRIVPLRDPVATDEIELQATNGGLSARSTFAQMFQVTRAQVDVTALELQNADWNRKVLVPAQGASTVIVPTMIVCEGVFNTTPFATVGAMNCGYDVTAPATGDLYPNVFIATADVPGAHDTPDMTILKGAGSRFDIAGLQSNRGSGFASQFAPNQSWKDASLVVNQPLVLWWDGTAFTGGDCLLRATCWYMTLPI